MSKRAGVSHEIAIAVASALSDQKAVDIRSYDITGRSVLADYVIMATGDVARHLDAMADTLRMKFKSMPRRSLEGKSESGWILVDFGDVVVHLFTAERRTYFDLDSIYASLARKDS